MDCYTNQRRSDNRQSQTMTPPPCMAPPCGAQPRKTTDTMNVSPAMEMTSDMNVMPNANMAPGWNSMANMNMMPNMNSMPGMNMEPNMNSMPDMTMTPGRNYMPDMRKMAPNMMPPTTPMNPAPAANVRTSMNMMHSCPAMPPCESKCGMPPTSIMPRTTSPMMNLNSKTDCPGMTQDCFDLQYTPGMAYIPWQHWDQTYNMSKGLQSGTIFPELDKPFSMGRCR